MYKIPQDIRTYDSASRLPAGWDACTDNPFQKQEILLVLERVNPCGQRYHMAGQSVFITYRLGLDILTYSSGKLKIPATILGLPMSVSSPGHSGDLSRRVLDYMKCVPGFKLILNTYKHHEPKGYSGGRTLPSSVFYNRWRHFDDYRQSLRSGYRYRVNKALKRGGVFERRAVDAKRFDTSLYALYLNVYRKSDFKLEKLPLMFFRDFPGVIIRFDYNGRAVGFIQLYGHEETLYFMFGGMDYRYVKGQDLYLNMLIEIIRYGIENKYKVIELGQTAEDIKQKLGAVPMEKAMYFTHSNRLVDCVSRLFCPLFTYGRKSGSFRVFRDK